MTFDDLIKSAEDTSKLPPGFMEGVERRIAMRELKQRQYALVRDALCLSGAFLLFFYSFSLLLVSTYTFETLDFLSLALRKPGLLALDALPFTSLLLTFLSIVICYFLLRALIRDITPFASTFFHRHAYS
jgi:hypothetical protein